MSLSLKILSEGFFMESKSIEECDSRPVFDVKLVPMLDRFKSARAMKISVLRTAFPDFAIAATFLYAIVMFTEISSAFRSNMEGLIILELIVLILFPFMFRVFATEEKPEFRVTPKLRFMTGWINSFNLIFILIIMLELAFLTSIAEGRKWIPLQLFMLIAIKVYTVFFFSEEKITPIAFCAKLTARLLGGVFFGVFTYFIAVIAVGLLLNKAMLSEISMLLVGYVFFVMMGTYTLFKQDFLYMILPPLKQSDDKKMICEICYPRLEVTRQAYKDAMSNDPEAESEDKTIVQTKKRKSYAFIILLVVLLLPAICLVPMRTKMIKYSKINTTEIYKNKVVWEDRFNLGAAVIFSTSMLWIFFVVTMMLARETVVRNSCQKRSGYLKIYLFLSFFTLWIVSILPYCRLNPILGLGSKNIEY